MIGEERYHKASSVTVISHALRFLSCQCLWWLWKRTIKIAFVSEREVAALARLFGIGFGNGDPILSSPLQNAFVASCHTQGTSCERELPWSSLVYWRRRLLKIRRTGPHQPLFDAVHPCQNATTDELTVYLSYSMFHGPAAACSSGAIAKYMAKDMRIICHQRRERYVSSSSAFCMFALCDYAINVAFAIIINTGHTRVFWDIFEILNTRRRQSRKKCS